MTTVAQYTSSISSTKDALFATIRDVRTVVDWLPAVQSVDWLSEGEGNHSDIGAARRCNFADGSSIVETCIEIQDNAEASLVRLKITEFSAPAKSMVMFMKVIPDGENSILTIGMEFEPIDLNMAGVLKENFEKTYKMVAEGIESYVTKVVAEQA